MKNILILGGGGREHAITRCLEQTAGGNVRLFCAPGNPGTAESARNLNIDPCNVTDVRAACLLHGIDLVIIGPEAPLDAGVSDALRESGIAVLGPSRAAAQLELSKSFARGICRQAGVRIPRYASFTDSIAALRYLHDHPGPAVIKADGAAGGKGVVVADDSAAASVAVLEFLDGRFGEASRRVVIEERLSGPEVSFFTLCHDRQAQFLGTACDYKRLLAGNKGPNTGGMGAFSPAPQERDLIETVLNNIVLPVLKVMSERGIPYSGVLYTGLMLTEDGPAVIEFNARLGDPEAQVLLPRLSSDAAELLAACAAGQLLVPSLTDEHAVTITLASAGYPGKTAGGEIIEGLSEALSEAVIFHAGTKRANGVTSTTGGRILNVTALAPDLAGAADQALRTAEKISFAGMQYRDDIGRD